MSTLISIFEQFTFSNSTIHHFYCLPSTCFFSSLLILLTQIIIFLSFFKLIVHFDYLSFPEVSSNSKLARIFRSMKPPFEWPPQFILLLLAVSTYGFPHEEKPNELLRADPPHCSKTPIVNSETSKSKFNCHISSRNSS